MTDTESEPTPRTTASVALERAPRQTLASDAHYMDRLPDMARQFAASAMCPDVWQLKPVPANASEQARAMIVAENERKVADLCIIGQSLAELDMRLSINTLRQVYVVKGVPGYMAQLQILLASRFNVPIVPLDEESDATKAVVKIVGKDRQWHRVTVTMAEAKLAKWPDRNPNYATMPDRMLMARAVTKAIDRHAPEVKMMLPPADLEEAAAADWSAVPEDETGELIPIPAAKRLVMQRLLERSTAEGDPLSEKQAGSMAATIWASHGLPSGKAMMPRSDVEALLDTIPVPTQPAAAVAPAGPAPAPQPDPEPEAPARGQIIDADEVPPEEREAQAAEAQYSFDAADGEPF